MRQPLLVYALIAAVLAAASGLAYYGYSYSAEINSRERALIIEMMGELAEEKVIGIESAMRNSDRAIFNLVDLENLLELERVINTERPAIESITLLDAEKKIIPGGALAKRRSREESIAFNKLITERVVQDLALDDIGLGERRHVHKIYDGRPYLFSYTRRYDEGRLFYIILEADLSYLVGTVFPQFFGVQSRRLHQVVNENGEIVYGFPFQGIPEADIVEIPFTETARLWRLRVAQREPSHLGSRTPRQVVDLVLIGLAMSVIVAGLAVLSLAMRRERKANELKSEFISNVSHELKTPLSIISMFGEMLAMGRTRSAEQATEYAEIIWRESVRLARLIDNVLDFAKIERGVDVYEFAEGDVGEVAERAVELSKHRLKRAEMEASLEIAPELPLLAIDSNALTLAILNLVDNAIKYAPEGGRIAIAVLEKRGGVELQVRDFGPGIAPEEQSQIFERFYRAQSVRLKPIRGSGIGLALVKHIAVAHGGDITVDSEPGRGATFRLWIPPRAAR